MKKQMQKREDKKAVLETQELEQPQGAGLMRPGRPKASPVEYDASPVEYGAGAPAIEY